MNKRKKYEWKENKVKKYLITVISMNVIGKKVRCGKLKLGCLTWC